jgi:tetratricopeptide (TPR) repeat protein
VTGPLSTIGIALRKLGRNEEALETCRRQLEILDRPGERPVPDLPSTLNNLAIVYDELERFSGAEPVYRRSIELLAHFHGPDHPWVGSTARLGSRVAALEVLEMARSTVKSSRKRSRSHPAVR